MSTFFVELEKVFQEQQQQQERQISRSYDRVSEASRSKSHTVGPASFGRVISSTFKPLG